MAYNELIKNFNRIRDYMKDFYVFGFKSRGDFTQKSARSYDDEKRRVESWLGDYMSFRHTPDGKNVFLSIDSRAAESNPLYTAWKTKSFTDGDITLHFILFDILYSPAVKMTLKEILDRIDREYLADFAEPPEFDESTVRKKLKEYVEEGLIRAEKDGRQMLYSRCETTDLTGASDVIDFFSETAPLGVIGSFLKDRLPEHRNIFSFKHHYINAALDSEILLTLLTAIREKRTVTLENKSPRFARVTTVEVLPLKILAGTQDGRWYLMSLHLKGNHFNAYRLDYLQKVKPGEVYEKFDTAARAYEKRAAHSWSVSCEWSMQRLEHVEFVVEVLPGEEHIVERLEREKRCGSVEQIDETHWRFSADIFNSQEILPWIRTFICRITQMDFSNRTVENKFKEDLAEIMRLYGLTDREAES
nr:WYL domain-containing protein [Lachnospiraceae bacterium]